MIVYQVRLSDDPSDQHCVVLLQPLPVPATLLRPECGGRLASPRRSLADTPLLPVGLFLVGL
jgi:hypothetical protein